MKYKDLGVLADIWDKTGKHSPKCPKCGGSITIIQAEPILDDQNAYIPYKTIIECDSCDFKIDTKSFIILGSVKDFDAETLEIASWAPSGSRVLSHYSHLLSYDLLKKLKKSIELVEFLVVNDQVIQIIG